MLVVVVRHWDQWFGPALVPGQHVAVDLLYVLSGFVIPFAYEPRLAQGMSLKTFLWLRIVRLYPLYLLATLAGAAFLFLRITLGSYPGEWTLPRLGATLAAALVFLPSPGPVAEGAPMYPLVGPAWSLPCVLAAELIYGLLWRRLRDLRLLCTLVGFSALVLTGAALHFQSLGLGADAHTWWGGYARALFGFNAGLLAFRLHERGLLARFRVPPLLLIGAFLALVFLTRGDDPVLFQLAIGLAAAPALIALGAQTQARGLTRRVFAFLGAGSYVVFCLHQSLFSFLSSLTHKLLDLNLAQGSAWFYCRCWPRRRSGSRPPTTARPSDGCWSASGLSGHR